MTSFFRISHNTFGKRGMPWAWKIAGGMINLDNCGMCGRRRRRPSDLKLLLEERRGTRWPDLLGCAYSYMVSSRRFVDAMREDGVRLELGGTVGILEPAPVRLSLDDAPRYVWIDGWKHLAGTMDFEASGYAGVRFCESCGARDEDVDATSRRQRAVPPPPIVFDYDDSLGLDLFTTDLSPLAFFCTDRVLRCASRNRLTNIEFRRVEEGSTRSRSGTEGPISPHKDFAAARGMRPFQCRYVGMGLRRIGGVRRGLRLRRGLPACLDDDRGQARHRDAKLRAPPRLRLQRPPADDGLPVRRRCLPGPRGPHTNLGSTRDGPAFSPIRRSWSVAARASS